MPRKKANISTTAAHINPLNLAEFPLLRDDVFARRSASQANQASKLIVTQPCRTLKPIHL